MTPITDKAVVLAYLASKAASKLGRARTPYSVLRSRTRQPKEVIDRAIIDAYTRGYITSNEPNLLRGYVTKAGKQLAK